MPDSERAVFLAEQRTMALATFDPRGDIHQIAMWFALDGEAPVFTSYRRSQKIVNLRRDPRLSMLVEAGVVYEELRGVSLVGVGEIIEDPAEILRVGRLISQKYGRPATSEPERYAGTRCAVRVKARRVRSWDHRNLTRPAAGQSDRCQSMTSGDRP